MWEWCRLFVGGFSAFGAMWSSTKLLSSKDELRRRKAEGVKALGAGSRNR